MSRREEGNGFDSRLKNHFDALVDLEEQRLELNERLKEVKALVKSDGYTPSYLMEVVKERFTDKELIKQKRAIKDLMRVAVGLDDTPMGDYAREEVDKQVRRQQGKPETPSKEEAEQEAQDALKEVANLPPNETKDDAYKRGFEAGTAGKPTKSNPYTIGEMRAAWDHGWMKGSGKTGFEIPDSLKPKKKPKKDGDGAGGGGSTGDGSQRDIEDADQDGDQQADKEAA